MTEMQDNILQARNHFSYYLSRVFRGKTVTLYDASDYLTSKENLQVGNPLNYKGDGHAMRTMDYTRVLYSAVWLVTRARAGNCIVEKASLTYGTILLLLLLLFHPRFSLPPGSLSLTWTILFPSRAYQQRCCNRPGSQMSRREMRWNYDGGE